MLITIVSIIVILDILINILLSENLKKKIGTTRNYSLKSSTFHHEIAPNINLYEFWGKKKYKVITNKYSMRVLNEEKRNIYPSIKNIGFIGDSFVYGSGIKYEDHFINLLEAKRVDYNLLNLGYVSYSPSIYYKKLKFYIEQNKIKFDKIFLFIDHSDIQDEGIFYREDKKGNIVRKWYSDDEVAYKKQKHYYKNYFKQNSFIYKLYENLNSPKISYKSKKCILDSSEKNYNDYLEIERFGYGYNENVLKKEWVFVGIKKINNYLDKILNLSKKYDFKIYLVYYPSALEVLNKINFNSSKHFIFLENWSKKNNITFINNYHAFNKSNDKTKNYLNNFIECDVHWNKKGHEIISNSLINYINE